VDLLNRVRRTSIEALQHQQTPFERVIESLRPERRTDRAPLVQMLFQFLDFGVHSIALGPVEVTRQPTPNPRAQVDLEVHIRPEDDESLHAGELRGTVVYSAELFEAATIDQLIESYLTLLQAATNNPNQRLGELPLLSVAQRRRLMLDWNA